MRDWAQELESLIEGMEQEAMQLMAMGAMPSPFEERHQAKLQKALLPLREALEILREVGP